jgi:predicted MFS family arabinose efflux permease
MTIRPDRRIIIPALGITQILAWGSTFYLLAVLGPLISKDTGWKYEFVVGGVSVALLVAGLAAPRVGYNIARRGGRPVLALGAVVLATGLTAVGLAPNLVCYIAGWAVIGLGMSASLYDAAFSTLGTLYGGESRGAIVWVTLFGGFASTVCWPLSALMATQLGWRGTCIAYAAIQLAIAAPTHLIALPRTRQLGDKTGDVKQSRSVQLRSEESVMFLLLASVVTIGASILSMMGTHLLPILVARGVDASVAVGLGAIVGPSQVGARAIEMLMGSRYHPIWTMVTSTIVVATASVLFLLNFPIVALAIVLYGAGNGIGSVARGTLPIALFGPDRYPVLMGRIALPLLVAMAVSPFLAGLAFERGGADAVLVLLTAVAGINVLLAGILLSVMTISKTPDRDGIMR